MELTAGVLSWSDATADVTLRTRVGAIASGCVAAWPTTPTDAISPVSKRMISERVALPASTGARMTVVAIAMRPAFNEEVSERWTLQ